MVFLEPDSETNAVPAFHLESPTQLPDQDRDKLHPQSIRSSDVHIFGNSNPVVADCQLEILAL